MFACVDAAYCEPAAAAACVAGSEWREETIYCQATTREARIAPYEPGAFYKRELPLIEKVLSRLTLAPDVIVIDGYVWLDAKGRQGLGAHLFEALGQRLPVIGVAKSSFAGAETWAELVYRGLSRRPLFVTAAGMSAKKAAAAVRRMHGANRIPTLLQRADALARLTITS